MRRRVILILLMVFFLLSVAAAGALFLMRPSVVDMQRRAAEDQLIEQIEAGQTQIEAISAPAVEGE